MNVCCIAVFAMSNQLMVALHRRRLSQQHPTRKQAVTRHETACVVLVIVEEMHGDILLPEEII